MDGDMGKLLYPVGVRSLLLYIVYFALNILKHFLQLSYCVYIIWQYINIF